MDIPTLATERLVLRPFRVERPRGPRRENADPRVVRAVEERAPGAFVGRTGVMRWEPWQDVEVAPR